MSYLSAIPVELPDTGVGVILPIILDGNIRKESWVTGR
jgi:hypothetical protein